MQLIIVVILLNTFDALTLALSILFLFYIITTCFLFIYHKNGHLTLELSIFCSILLKKSLFYLLVFLFNT